MFAVPFRDYIGAPLYMAPNPDPVLQPVINVPEPEDILEDWYARMYLHRGPNRWRRRLRLPRPPRPFEPEDYMAEWRGFEDPVFWLEDLRPARRPGYLHQEEILEEWRHNLREPPQRGRVIRRQLPRPIFPLGDPAYGVNQPPVRTVLTQRTIAGERREYYYRGEKRENKYNTLPDPNIDKTSMYVVQPYAQPAQQYWRDPLVLLFGKDRFKKSLKTDADLVAYLRLEAAFLPRTPLLAVQLRVKAKKWLNEFDKSAISHDEAYELIVSAVMQAYEVDRRERLASRIMDFSQGLSNILSLVLHHVGWKVPACCVIGGLATKYYQQYFGITPVNLIPSTLSVLSQLPLASIKPNVGLHMPAHWPTLSESTQRAFAMSLLALRRDIWWIDVPTLIDSCGNVTLAWLKSIIRVMLN